MTSGLKGFDRNSDRRAQAKKRADVVLQQAVNVASYSLLEPLEDRRLLSAGSTTLNNGELDIISGQTNSKITINLDDTDQTKLNIVNDGVTSTFNVADVKLIVAKGGSGSDSITTEGNTLSITTPEKIYGGNGTNYLVGGDGPDTIYGGSGADKIMGGFTSNKIDGGGGGDLINTQGAPSVVARHRHQQVVDGGGATLGTVDKHHRYIKSDKVKSTVVPRVEVTGPAAAGAYTPAQIKHAYGLDQLDTYNTQYPLYTNTGEGETIVIVGAYPSRDFINPTLPGDLEAFDAAFGLPDPGAGFSFQTVQASGQTQQTDQTGELETALDVEWAHAMAPQASIILVEVDSSGGTYFGSDLVLGVQEAANQANQAGGAVVSMSFGTTSEDPQLQAQFDAVFGSKSNRDISWIASAGDDAGDVSSPATSPYVTTVGGTVLSADAAGNIVSQTAWLYGGGGVSTIEAKPAFQSGLTINGRSTGSMRTVPDISLVAEARFGAVQVYTGATPLIASQDVSISGTSVGAPIFAGMIADLNELRSTQRQAVIGSQLNTQLYAAYNRNPYGTAGNFTDITAGNNSHQAYPGYDLATGIGSPQAQTLIPTLAGIQISDVPLVLHGDEIGSLASASTGLLVNPVQAVGDAIIGPLTISLVLSAGKTPAPAPQLTAATLVVSRNLDNTFSGVTTIMVNDTTTDATGATVTVTNTYIVKITGKVTVGHLGREHISGTIVTIDPNTGAEIRQGLQQIFTATFTG